MFITWAAWVDDDVETTEQTTSHIGHDVEPLLFITRIYPQNISQKERYSYVRQRTIMVGYLFHSVRNQQKLIDSTKSHSLQKIGLFQQNLPGK